MSVLPRAVPAKFTEQLRAALTAAGVTFDATLKPGSRIQYDVTHQGHTWTVGYLMQGAGQPWWRVTGPTVEHGKGADTAGVVATITTPLPEPEPEPADPHPGAPRTHLGFELPEFVRAEWDSPRAEWFRLGLAAAVGKLPDTRPRA
ncbi:hypothetical protein ACFW5V_32405 [Streptomyces sp. NPDC058762]|uniref:hypothetical protein n=1 Tax=Streptomyces sp. NPDC058762 TaxID=3346629 RepID=UPI0036D119AA